jgi:serine/threonine protein phosphatase PrpC
MLRLWHRRHEATSPLETSLLSDIGCCRTTNEDAGQVIRPAQPRVLAKKGTLLLVADGMGGCEGGEIASQLAVETVRRSYYASRAQIPAALVEAFQEANRVVYRLSLDRPELKGMGTTCTALVLCRDLAWVAYVGDTRLYLIRKGSIYQLIEDHSAVMELVKQGLLSREEARRHPDRNVILRALGTHEQVAVATWNEPMPVRSGDRFVVCSDGLYEVVSDEEILSRAESESPPAASAALIALARARGASDNITVGMAYLVPQPMISPHGARETRAFEVTQ